VKEKRVGGPQSRSSEHGISEKGRRNPGYLRVGFWLEIQRRIDYSLVSTIFCEAAGLGPYAGAPPLCVQNHQIIGMAIILGDTNIFARLQSPSFDQPPVVETALGVQFAPLEGFDVLHLGQLFSLFKEIGYSKYQLKPPVGQQEIRLAEEGDFAKFPLRCWYITPDESQLVQIQREFFIRNWRATDANAEYQHFTSIMPLFQRDWVLFCSFLREQGMKAPEVSRCDVTYINHLLRGEDWETYDDLSALFPIWRGIELKELFTAIEVGQFLVGFKLPEGAGHIQFTLQPAVRNDGKELFQLTVTASGKPLTSNDSDLFKWLDLGHLAVVNGFVQFTSEKAHRKWGKR